MVITFKNLLQNQQADFRETWSVASGTPAHHRLFKCLPRQFGHCHLLRLNIGISDSTQTAGAARPFQNGFFPPGCNRGTYLTILKRSPVQLLPKPYNRISSSTGFQLDSTKIIVIHHICIDSPVPRYTKTNIGKSRQPAKSMGGGV